MILNIFDCCLSVEGQYPENRIYLILFCSIFFYVILFVLIKNVIYYSHISENIYWLLLILFIFDLTFFINNNREFIELKIRDLSQYSFIKKKENKCTKEYKAKQDKTRNQLNNKLKITEDLTEDLIHKDLEQGLNEEDIITQIIV